jgi:hypothetical protein
MQIHNDAAARFGRTLFALKRTPDACSALSLFRRNVSQAQLGVRFSNHGMLVNVGNHYYTWSVRPHATTTIWRRVPLEYNPLWFNPGQRLHLRMTTQTGVNPRAWPGPIHCVPNWTSDCSLRLGTAPSMLPQTSTLWTFTATPVAAVRLTLQVHVYSSGTQLGNWQ